MDTKTDLHRFGDQVKELVAGLKDRPPAPGSILFYGSSTMANWRENGMCTRQLAPLPIVNTGFGGATAEELLYHYHSLVLPVKPSMLVYYGGANDLQNDYTPAEILDTTQRIFEWCRQDFPGIRFLILPIKLSPGLPIDMKEGRQCNADFATYAATHADTGLIDVDPLLYDSAGNHRMEIYLEDKLHHNEQGYKELSVIVKNAIKAGWKPKS
ncbi:MAG: hypothetical protein HQL31_01990 [Planctomycetes bacterium]|nr:hypothetical protein [Planctomycetota bacterium]